MSVCLVCVFVYACVCAKTCQPCFLAPPYKGKTKKGFTMTAISKVCKVRMRRCFIAVISKLYILVVSN